MREAADDSLPRLSEVIECYGLSARKSLGQNFLLDLNLTRKIARTAGSLEGFTVIEVGPGPGGLTRALLMEGADRIVAVERDERALPALPDISAAWPGRLTVGSVRLRSACSTWPSRRKGSAPRRPEPRSERRNRPRRPRATRSAAGTCCSRPSRK